MHNYKNTSDALSVFIIVITLAILIQESCQETAENSKQKRAAWMPQGRMGKRYREALYKKAAWVPQGRFGKRVPEETPQIDSELTPNSHLAISQLLSSVLKQDPNFVYGDNSLNSAVKRMPRMGVYRSKKSDGYFQSLADASVSRNVDALGNGGEPLLRQLEVSDKRAAWVPQGRFGKRSVAGGDLNDNNSGDKIRLTNISQHPTDPNALCFTVTKGPQKHVMQCLQMNADGTSVELMPSEHKH